MQKMRSLIALWLAIAAIGASAQRNGTVSGERMPDQVLMSDGSTQGTGISHDGATEDNR